MIMGETMVTKFIFGENSSKHLSQVHPDLRAIAELALSWGIMDFTIYTSIRPKGEQNRAYMMGDSKVQWPNSKHNILKPEDLSDAMDIAPYINGNISWETSHCIFLAGIMSAAAAELGIGMRWGGDWDMDGEPITDQSFNDLVHFERRKAA